MDLSALIGVGVGGLIGFVSAYVIEANKWRREKKINRQRLDRLLQILYEEVEQLAELIDVDLSILDSEELDFALGFGKGSEEYDGRLRSTIARLQENRTIYDSQAPRFLDLPGYLPNSLVRFYTRLQVNCGRMLAAIEEGDLEKIRKMRSDSLDEAEVLKRDLRGALSNHLNG